jgi:hypothetical protein
LKAGENTLDTLVTRVLIKSMIEKKALDLASYRADYITFMTTPGKKSLSSHFNQAIDSLGCVRDT